MAIISVREYEQLRISEFDPALPSISKAQAELLVNLRPIYGFDVFRYFDGNHLVAQQFVGTFQLGSHTVEVLPKIDAGITCVRRNLVFMLAVALDIEISEGDIAQVANQNNGVLEIIIRIFCDKLFAQVRRGLVRRYEAREENLPVLRGKLGISEQVRLNAANPERLFCRFDEFQEDNPLNQILKAALRLLLNVSRSMGNQRKLAELLLMFEGASSISVQSLPWGRVVFDRTNERFKSCFKLAEQFLKSTPPDVTGGRNNGFSLFFDMNVLFEEYVGRMARRVYSALGFQVTLQSPQRYLALDETNNRSVFAMKPDVVGRKSSNVEWIIDTKWKLLSTAESKEGVAQSDMYQMYAYAKRFGCSNVILIYPHHGELGSEPGLRNSYELELEEGISEPRQRISVSTISLADLSSVPNQLLVLFKTLELFDSAKAANQYLVAGL